MPVIRQLVLDFFCYVLVAFGGRGGGKEDFNFQFLLFYLFFKFRIPIVTQNDIIVARILEFMILH